MLYTMVHEHIRTFLDIFYVLYVLYKTFWNFISTITRNNYICWKNLKRIRKWAIAIYTILPLDINPSLQYVCYFYRMRNWTYYLVKLFWFCFVSTKQSTICVNSSDVSILVWCIFIFWSYPHIKVKDTDIGDDIGSLIWSFS